MIEEEIAPATTTTSWKSKSMDTENLGANRWLWPFDAVSILDIRHLRDDKGQTLNSRKQGYLVDIVQSDSMSNFNRASENMENLKSSLKKIGMDIDQETVRLEEDCEMNLDGWKSNPPEGSRPRICESEKGDSVSSDKINNVFQTRSRDAGISASWTRFSRLDSLENVCQ